MNWTGKIGETLRALIVLALFCLNFSHAPVSAAPADAYAPLTLISFCGDAADHDNGKHAPCHACRIGAGADLPGTCGAVEPAFTVDAIAYVARPGVTPTGTRLLGPSARGPPAA